MNPQKRQPINASSAKPPLPTLRKVSKRSYRWVWMIIGLTGVALLSATAGAILAMTMASTPLMQRKLSPTDAAVFSKGNLSSVNNLQLPELTRPVNILVLGAKVLTSDLTDDSAQQNLGYHSLVNSFEGLTDTMLLLRFDPATKKVVLLSIPRDTRVEISGYGVNKINAANSLGGPALSARAVSELLGGIGIDRYVTINVQGVEALIDALGGVTVYVPKDMKYQDDSQHLYVNLKAGKQHLNGNQALQLLRFRNDELGDIGRVQRQQMVMRALSEQTLNPATVARLPKILSVVKSHIDTNLTVEELVALVGFATNIDRSNMQMLIVPGEYGDISTYGTSYWLPDANRISSLAAQYFDVGTTAIAAGQPTNLRISIQDSTRQASSEALVTRLGQAGYSNVIIADPYGEPLAATRIVAQQGDIKNAEALRQVLGVGEIRVDSAGDLNSDVTIQLGQDWLQKQPRSSYPTSNSVAKR
ncbi:MAG: LCP family protein [Oscillatoriales cyanobacterium C42_A2020_001]|nr:LCP family protein [Leptolyngbyaceae cyanobacterium C42_A2020_001]